MIKGRITAVVIRNQKDMHIRSRPCPRHPNGGRYLVVRAYFVDALVTGTKTLLYSAEVLENAEGGQEYEPDKLSLWLEKRFGKKAALNAMLYASVVPAILFTVGVFIILPTWVVNIFELLTGNEIVLNLLEGVFRILMFVGYVAVISRMKDIRTVFQFHGAEHNCIHCYETVCPYHRKLQTI